MDKGTFIWPPSSSPLQGGGGKQMIDGNNFGSTHIKNEHREKIYSNIAQFSDSDTGSSGVIYTHRLNYTQSLHKWYTVIRNIHAEQFFMQM